MLKKILKQIVKSVLWHYYVLRHRSFIWFYILNREGRKLYRRATPEFTAKEQQIISAVERDGIAFAHISDFFDEGVYQSLRQFVAARWRGPNVQEKFRNRGAHLTKNVQGKAMIDGKNYFLIELWNGSHVLDLGHVFIQFSLSKPILTIVSGYLKMYPKFRYFELQATVPSIAGDEGNARASQKWHRDPDDRKLLKVFLYINDVAKDAGPFMYVKGTHSMGRHCRLFPGKTQGVVVFPKVEDSMLPTEDIVVATGRAGTLIFADTSGLHKGGLAESKNRFMYTSAYMSAASLWPMRYTYPKNFGFSTLKDPLVRYAVDNDPFLKEPWY